jgi:hypothetical protein
MQHGETYSFGKLNAAQKQIVSAFVRGRVVHDIGAGEHALSKQLIDLGAREVFAIEAATRLHGRLEYGTPYEAITSIPVSFRQYGRMTKSAKSFARAEGGRPLGPARPIQIAFISWPTPEDSKFKTHSDYSILGLVRRAPIVIYLGSNMDGVMCGSRKLYEHLARRKVLAHEPSPQNTLIVYDGLLPAGKTRELLPEERAGIDVSKVYRYKEAYPTVTAADVLGRK